MKLNVYVPVNKCRGKKIIPAFAIKRKTLWVIFFRAAVEQGSHLVTFYWETVMTLKSGALAGSTSCVTSLRWRAQPSHPAWQDARCSLPARLGCYFWHAGGYRPARTSRRSSGRRRDSPAFLRGRQLTRSKLFATKHFHTNQAASVKTMTGSERGPAVSEGCWFAGDVAVKSSSPFDLHKLHPCIRKQQWSCCCWGKHGPRCPDWLVQHNEKH